MSIIINRVESNQNDVIIDVNIIDIEFYQFVDKKKFNSDLVMHTLPIKEKINNLESNLKSDKQLMLGDDINELSIAIEDFCKWCESSLVSLKMEDFDVNPDKLNSSLSPHYEALYAQTNDHIAIVSLRKAMNAFIDSFKEHTDIRFDLLSELMNLNDKEIKVKISLIDEKSYEYNVEVMEGQFRKNIYENEEVLRYLTKEVSFQVEKEISNCHVIKNGFKDLVKKTVSSFDEIEELNVGKFRTFFSQVTEYWYELLENEKTLPSHLFRVTKYFNDISDKFITRLVDMEDNLNKSYDSYSQAYDIRITDLFSAKVKNVIEGTVDLNALSDSDGTLNYSILKKLDKQKSKDFINVSFMSFANNSELKYHPDILSGANENKLQGYTLNHMPYKALPLAKKKLNIANTNETVRENESVNAVIMIEGIPYTVSEVFTKHNYQL